MPLTPVDDATESTPDLAELLEQRGLRHWLSPLLKLCDHHQGWLADLEYGPEFDPDFRPLAEVVDAARALPPASFGDDAALAEAISLTDFMARAAVNRQAGPELWDPLAESYRCFCKRHPERVPFWSHAPQGVAVRLVQWVHTSAATGD